MRDELNILDSMKTLFINLNVDLNAFLASQRLSSPFLICTKKSASLLAQLPFNLFVIEREEITLELVEVALKEFSANMGDAVIAIGEDKVLDFAKIVTLKIKESYDIALKQENLNRHHLTNEVPLILVPTQIFSLSTVNKKAYCAKKPFKIGKDSLVKTTVLIDNNLFSNRTSEESALAIASTYIIALESFIAETSFTLSHSFSKNALSILLKEYKRFLLAPFDKDILEIIGEAIALSLLSFSFSQISLAHALASAISQQSGIDYSLALFILFPHTLEYQVKREKNLEEKLDEVTRFLSLELSFTQFTKSFFTKLNSYTTHKLPRRFYDIVDVENEKQLILPKDLDDIASFAFLSEEMLAVSTKISSRQIIRVLEAAYWGYNLETN